MIITQKKAKITYSMGTAARAKISKTRGIGLGMLVLGLGMLWAGASQLGGSDATVYLVFGGILVMIASAVPFVMANPVKAVKFRDGWFRVKGCSKEFLATLPVQASPF